MTIRAKPTHGVKRALTHARGRRDAVQRDATRRHATEVDYFSRRLAAYRGPREGSLPRNLPGENYAGAWKNSSAVAVAATDVRLATYVARASLHVWGIGVRAGEKADN